jgi:hypothetical protein
MDFITEFGLGLNSEVSDKRDIEVIVEYKVGNVTKENE